MGKRLVFALCVGVILWGCASQERFTYEGKSQVFRGRWWSYYQRGCSHLTNGAYDLAVADFEEALRGRSRDAWQARTYGLHFVEYFPNRELGVAYFHLDRLDEAEGCFERSLDQIDTERAHHYKDLVARTRIAKGELEDASEPAIETSLLEGAIISERELAFEVVARDDTGVYNVDVNGEKVPQRGSTEEFKAEQKVLLTEGTHEIRVAASDLADKGVEKVVKVEVDLTGPNIGIFVPREPMVTEDAAIPLEGTCIDKNGVTSVALGERMLAESKGERRVDFTADLPLAEGENSFLVLAKDVAGNETQSVLKVFKGKPGSVAANLWLLKQKAPHLLEHASAHSPAQVAKLVASAQAVLAANEEPVSVSLSSPREGEPYRHNKTLAVSGEVNSQGNVAALSINGEPFEPLTGAPKESFCKRIALDEEVLKQGAAQMPLSVVAKDEAGHEAKVEFPVNLEPIFLDSRDSKMPVAVLAFGGEGVDVATGGALRDETEGRLLSGGRFRVLDRMQLQEVLTEQQLAAALADPDQAIQLGKIENVHVMLVGNLYAREGGVEVKARAISAETSDLLATFDTYIEDKGDADALRKGCNAIAAQVEAAFPRLSGELMVVKGAKLKVNWTKEDGIHEGMYMLVVQEDEDFGDITGVCRARLLRFVPDGSIAEEVGPRLEGGEDVELKEGMAAITM